MVVVVVVVVEELVEAGGGGGWWWWRRWRLGWWRAKFSSADLTTQSVGVCFGRKVLNQPPFRLRASDWTAFAVR